MAKKLKSFPESSQVKKVIDLCSEFDCSKCPLRERSTIDKKYQCSLTLDDAIQVNYAIAAIEFKQKQAKQTLAEMPLFNP